MLIRVVPAGLEARVGELLGRPEWTLRASRAGRPERIEDALAEISPGEALFFLPRAVQLPSALRRIVVLHDAGPRATAGVEIADQVALATGAEIVVLHIPSGELPAEPGSLPGPRFADHAGEQWLEWQQEYLRRFCRCSPGVRLSLEVALGPLLPSLRSKLRDLGPELVVMTWRGEARLGRARLLKSVSRSSTSPLLVLTAVPAEASDDPAGRGGDAQALTPAGGASGAP